MRVEVLFFASLADIVGSRRIAVELAEGATVADLVTEVAAAYPKIRAYDPVLLTAVNDEYVARTHAIADGDEVALFPPVSGGGTGAGELTRDAAGEFYQITWDPIDAAAVARRLLAATDGAVCVFEGVVRNNSKGKATRHLVYEAHERMALKKMEEIGRLVREVWEIGAVAIVHRLGRLEIGETSVAIVVAAPHRRAAFDACHYAIDRLKKIVPIWKKEYFEDGELWVEGQS